MFNFILKGLLRDRNRSLLPIIVIGAGVMLMNAFYGYMEGMISDSVSLSAKLDSGHVKVMTKEYDEISHQSPNDFAIYNLTNVLSELNRVEGVTWVPRIKFGGLLDVPDSKGETRAQGPVRGIAVDLFSKNSTEVERLDLKKAVIEGEIPSEHGEIIVSKQFGKNLNLKLGETATIIGSTANGSMAIYNFKVVGFTKFGIPSLDRNMMFADLSDIQYAMDMENAAGEILGFGKKNVVTEEIVNSLKNKVKTFPFNESVDFNNELVVRSLIEQGGTGEYLGLQRMMLFIIVGALLIVMSIVIWNSSLMSGLRRYGEIGLRLALGESKGELYRFLIYESAVVGLIGGILGSILGTLFCLYLQEVGIDISSMMQGSTIIISPVLHARVTLTGVLIGLVPGVLAAILGTALAGIGIYKRETASLFKELEV